MDTITATTTSSSTVVTSDENPQRTEQNQPSLHPVSAELLAKYRNTVQTFRANRFKPATIFTASEHYQTIVGSGALSVKLAGGNPPRPFKATSETFDTPDGDIFEVDYTENFDASDDVVIILHGLESSPRGILVTRFASAFLSKGFGCVLFGFRGCNGDMPRTPGGYHVGFTQDISQLVDTLNARHPTKRFYLCGFSLGGNVSLKFLGELGDRALEKNIYGGAVTCVPFDPAGCQRKIDLGFNRLIYSKNFLSTLKVKAEEQHKTFPGSFDIDGVRSAKTIGEFDDAYIAKIYGFQDKFDYYRQCGSKWWLHKIRVPTFAMNALDDPFIDETSLPNEKDVGEAPVRLIYHAKGGHCGFSTNRMSTEPNSPAVPSYGWLAEELSRMIDHIREGVKAQSLLDSKSHQSNSLVSSEEVHIQTA